MTRLDIHKWKRWSKLWKLSTAVKLSISQEVKQKGNVLCWLLVNCISPCLQSQPTLCARETEKARDGRWDRNHTFIYPKLTSHTLSCVLKEEVGHWMDVKVNTSAIKGLRNWKAPLDVKQPNGNTVQEDKAVLSINKKSIPFHGSERLFLWGLSLFSFCLFFFPSPASTQ